MEVRIETDPATRLKSAGIERKVLACIYKSTDSWLDASSILAEDFAHPLNRALWQIMDALYTSNVPLSPVTVSERVPDELRRELEEQGGWALFTTWEEMPIDPKAIKQYIEQMKALTVRRRARALAARTEHLADTESDPKVVIESVQEWASELDGPAEDEGRLMGAEGEEYLTKLVQMRDRPPGIPTGFDHLDESIDGFEGSGLYVMAGWLKSGKSAWLLNCAKHQAVDNQVPVLYISTEQSWEQEYRRLLATTSGVREKLIKKGAYPDNDTWFNAVQDGKAAIAAAPMYFVHTKDFSVPSLAKLVMKYVRRHGVRVVYFDYIKAPENAMLDKNVWGQIGQLAFGLKDIADKWDIPVVTAVQINRQGANEMRLGGDIGAEFFAGSIDIGRALSCGLSIRKLNREEQKAYPQFMESPSLQYRVVEVNENRFGPTSYKWLWEFQADTLTLLEKESIR